MTSVQESLDAAQTERAETGKARIMSLDSLQKNAAAYRLDIEEKTESVRNSADAAAQVGLKQRLLIPADLNRIITIADRDF